MASSDRYITRQAHKPATRHASSVDYLKKPRKVFRDPEFRDPDFFEPVDEPVCRYGDYLKNPTAAFAETQPEPLQRYGDHLKEREAAYERSAARRKAKEARETAMACKVAHNYHGRYVKDNGERDEGSENNGKEGDNHDKWVDLDGSVDKDDWVKVLREVKASARSKMGDGEDWQLV